MTSSTSAPPAEIKREAAINYLRSNPDALAPFIKPENLQQAQRIERYLIDDAIDIATNFIRVAKELPAQAHELAQQLQQQSGTWPLLDFGVRIYADYQRSLALRGAVDFDDLILLALQALEADEGYLLRLRDRWPYVLEDEAQDSSSAQEKMLRLLTGGGWELGACGGSQPGDQHHIYKRKHSLPATISAAVSGAGTRSAQLGAQCAPDHRPGQFSDRLVAALLTHCCLRRWP